MELSLSEDATVEGKAMLQLPLWLPVSFSLPAVSLVQTPCELQPRVWHGHGPFSRQLFQESSHFHAWGSVENTTVSKEPAENWVKTAGSAEVFLELLILNCNQIELGANVGTAQLNTSVGLARAL